MINGHEFDDECKCNDCMKKVFEYCEKTILNAMYPPLKPIDPELVERFKNMNDEEKKQFVEQTKKEIAELIEKIKVNQIKISKPVVGLSLADTLSDSYLESIRHGKGEYLVDFNTIVFNRSNEITKRKGWSIAAQNVKPEFLDNALKIYRPEIKSEIQKRIDLRDKGETYAERLDRVKGTRKCPCSNCKALVASGNFYTIINGQCEYFKNEKPKEQGAFLTAIQPTLDRIPMATVKAYISESSTGNPNHANDPEDESDFGSFSLTAEELEELRKVFEGNTEEEKLIDLQFNNETPPPIPSKKIKKYRYKPDECNYHSWEKTGSGPVSGQPWFNCVYCGIAKEKVDKS